MKDDADVLERSKTNAAPPKRWFNWWVPKFDGVTRINLRPVQAGVAYRAARAWPSKEIAEQRAIEEPLRCNADYVGAFPEGECP